MNRRNSSRTKSNSISVDFTGVNSTARMDDGEYLGTIKEVTQEKSSNSGNEMLVFTITVEGSDFKYYCPLIENSLWKLRDLLECAGFEVPESKMDLDLDELVGVEIGVVIENETYQGKQRPKVVATVEPGEAEEAEEEPEPETKKPAGRGGKKSDPPKEEPKSTTRRRPAAKEEPEEEGFKKGDKVEFVDEGKTLKGTVEREDEEEEGSYIVKVGKEEWAIPGDELTKI